MPVTSIPGRLPRLAIAGSPADAEEARRRGTDGFRFFQFALAHHYVFGKHTPGRTNIWNRYLAVRDQLGHKPGVFRGTGESTANRSRGASSEFADIVVALARDGSLFLSPPQFSQCELQQR